LGDGCYELVGAGRLGDHRSWRAGYPRVAEPAVEHERHVLLPKALEKLLRVSVTKPEVYDCSANVIALDQMARIGQRAGDGYGRTGTLKGLGDIQRDERLILDDENGMSR
jgi:hypothetical protein